MARSEARISVSIWNDEDFVALPPGPQRTFLMLVSQPDISYAGVIALRERRWSRLAAGLTREAVEADLEELVRTRFVVIDEDTEELLVRSFMRNDGVHRQPNVLRAALRDVEGVSSPAIRAALLPEVERMATAEGLPEASGDLLADLARTLRQGLPDGHAEGMPNPSENPSPNPSAKGSRQDLKTEGGRGNVTAVSSDSPFPLPPDPPPAAVPPTAGAKSRRTAPKDDEPTAQLILSEYIDRCRKRPAGQVIGQLGKLIKAMLAEGIDPDDIRRGLAQWMTKGLNPSTLPSVVTEVMNAVPQPAPATLPASNAPRAIPPDERCPDHPFSRRGQCRACASIAEEVA